MSARSFRVEWAEVARQDLRQIADYLARESPTAALKMLDRLERRAATLESLPHRGRVPPELAALEVELYRELQTPPYRLLYRVYEELVVVLAVFDGRRDLEDILLRRLLSV